jgi:hypothetical protein
MRISLDLWALKTRFDRQGSLQKVQSSSHFPDAAIIAGHIVEGHCLPKFIVFTKLF